MDSMGLSGGFVASAGQSFKMICLELLDAAYTEVRAEKVVTQEWEENAISEIIAERMNNNPEAIQRFITVELEKRMITEAWCESSVSVNAAPRIDIKIGGFSWNPNLSRVQCFMEAKNLYGDDFRKANNSTITSSSYYGKRYVLTGINNVLSSHYPGETILLGYVLVGSIQKAVDKVNEQLSLLSRDEERVSMQAQSGFPHLDMGVSRHPNGATMDHYFLLFPRT